MTATLEEGWLFTWDTHMEAGFRFHKSLESEKKLQKGIKS